jgi:hypothetical protein
MNIGVQLAKRASTEIVLSFDQVIVGCGGCQARQGKYDCWSAGSQRSLVSNISMKRKADFQERIQISDLKVDVKISRLPDFEIPVRRRKAWLCRIRI